MAEKPETKLVRKTIALLRKQGVLATKIHGDPAQPVMLDVVICAQGFYAELEAKVGDNEPTDIQRHRMQQVKDAGGITGVFRTPDEALAILAREIEGFRTS